MNKLRCLVLSYRYPFPPLKGDQLRLAYFLRESQSQFQAITVAYLEGPENPEPPQGIDNVRFVRLEKPSISEAIGGWLKTPTMPLQTLPAMSKRARYWVEGALQEHERVLAVTLRVAPLLQGAEFRGVLDFIDALSLNMHERAFASSPAVRPLLRLEEKLLRDYEETLIEVFPKAFVVSKRDWAHLGGHSKIKVIPNGVDYEFLTYTWQPTKSKTIVFLGRMDYPPNIDAAIFFARQVFPIIRTRRPEARFSIVGANPHPKVKSLAYENGIEVSGFVKDIRPHLSRAAAFVAPLRWASGMQNKVLEAMAVGAPVLTTPKVLAGFEGVEPGRHLLVAETPGGLAEAVLDILSDNQEALRISKEARALIETKYNWKSVGKRMALEIMSS